MAQTDSHKAEMALVRGVIRGAFAVLKQAKKRQQNGAYVRVTAAETGSKEDRSQAIAETVAWFRRESEEPWSLEWCCKVLRGFGDSVEAEELRKRAQRVLEG